MNSNRKAAFLTLGCKVNQYETDAMKELLEADGYEIVDFKEPADVYIINTCSVTNMADRKSRQMIHRAKKNNPDAVIAAAGCYVQASEQDLIDNQIADVLIGNNKKKESAQILDRYFENRKNISEVVDIAQTKDYESLTIHKVSEHTRAYIKIQDGCNQFCSYCIIPYARGRVRSRKPEDIFSEVFSLAKAGYKEIVLTGIHISSYGKDFEEQENLISLVEKLAVIEGIERIRFGSLEPGFITEDVVVRLAAIEKICPHFHLSLQSGCNETLKRMNRHYTAEEYEEKCKLLRRYFDRPSFTTDVIVGFPGETEEEFEQTEAFLEKIHFAEMHIFKYSPRKGTRAAVMPDQIDERIKTERSAKLLALAEKMSSDYQADCQDKVLQVLIEEKVPSDDGEVWIGHSREYLKCAVKSDKIRSNDLVNCQMTRTKGEDFVFCKIID